MKTKNNLPNQPKEPLSPRLEGFLPMLLATVSMLITLLATVIDKFIFPFGEDMLSPALGQIIILLIPAYLCLLFLSPEKSLGQQLKAIGIGKLRADYVFFIIFAALFTVSGALLLDMLFGGVKDAAQGFTVLASFTAGESEYAVNYPYLILVYAVFPALLEEAVFRGVIFGELRRVSEPLAVLLSSLLSTLFAFTLGGIPASLFCAVCYCFVLLTTGSLQACMIVHLIYGLYALFWKTNVSAYFLSSQSNTLLIVIVVAAWLISASLFFTESARLYKARAAKIVLGEEKSALPSLHIKTLLQEIRAVFSYTPTLICAAVCLALYVAITVICALT